MTDHSVVDDLAALLDRASTTGTAIPQLSGEHELDIAEAYLVQRALVDRRIARGEQRAGVKLGLTSIAKAAQMGVSDVIIGELTSGMLIPDGGTMALDRCVHPRIEPEVAFRLARTIDPAEPPGHAREATDAIAPALEIIDSRYRDFRFSLTDVIADNTSAAGAVVGPWQPLPPDTGDLQVRLRMDDRTITSGSTAAILGDPVRAIDAAIRMAATYDFPLPEGAVILAGAATEAVPFTPGSTVRATVAGLGDVTVTAGGR